jgi:hypothetical protein
MAAMINITAITNRQTEAITNVRLADSVSGSHVTSTGFRVSLLERFRNPAADSYFGDSGRLSSTRAEAPFETGGLTLCPLLTAFNSFVTEAPQL